MGNDLVVSSQKAAYTNANDIERASLSNLAGTWFVDDQKIVIENNLATVYQRNESECWVHYESLEVKDQHLYFQFKDHILSKGRMRADSNELMFRNGEDVRLWTREDPFYMVDHEIEDMAWSTCLPGLNTSDSTNEVGGECLSLRHPSEMGANKCPKKYDEPELTPTDSYEEGLPVPDDSAEEPLPDDYLPPVNDLDLEYSATRITKSKSAIIVPSKGYDDDDFDDSMLPDDSSDYLLSMSDIDSSDDMVEASWVDEQFFASEV